MSAALSSTPRVSVDFPSQRRVVFVHERRANACRQPRGRRRAWGSRWRLGQPFGATAALGQPRRWRAACDGRSWSRRAAVLIGGSG